ncbi:MAG: spore coat protein [Bacillota bacterium]
MNLSERDILMDLLIDAKYISTGYHNALLESADDMVRNTLVQIHNDELASHKIVFDTMNSRGYYRVQPATPLMSGAALQTGMQGQQQMNRQMGANMGNTMGNMMSGTNTYQYGNTGYQAGQQQYGQDLNRNNW